MKKMNSDENDNLTWKDVASASGAGRSSLQSTSRVENPRLSSTRRLLEDEDDFKDDTEEIEFVEEKPS